MGRSPSACTRGLWGCLHCAVSGGTRGVFETSSVSRSDESGSCKGFSCWIDWLFGVIGLEDEDEAEGVALVGDGSCGIVEEAP